MITFKLLRLCISFLTWYIALDGCSSCVGAVTKKSPPFFSDRLYKAKSSPTHKPTMIKKEAS